MDHVHGPQHVAPVVGPVPAVEQKVNGDEGHDPGGDSVLGEHHPPGRRPLVHTHVNRDEGRLGEQLEHLVAHAARQVRDGRVEPVQPPAAQAVDDELGDDEDHEGRDGEGDDVHHGVGSVGDCGAPRAIDNPLRSARVFWRESGQTT